VQGFFLPNFAQNSDSCYNLAMKTKNTKKKTLGQLLRKRLGLKPTLGQLLRERLRG
jgi:hypothetical protein